MAKKFFVALTLLAVMLTSSIALAAYAEHIAEGVDLMTVKRIAVAYPQYYRTTFDEPTIDELTNDLYNAGKAVAHIDILSYEEIAAAIRRDTGVDILSLEVDEAEKVFKEHVAKYADAYIVETITNGPDHPTLLFYVYNAADSAIMYNYAAQSRHIGKKTKDYQKTAEDFFKQFNVAAEKKLSKAERKKIEAADKKKAKDKSGKSKADLVAKK